MIVLCCFHILGLDPGIQVNADTSEQGHEGSTAPRMTKPLLQIIVEQEAFVAAFA